MVVSKRNLRSKQLIFADIVRCAEVVARYYKNPFGIKRKLRYVTNNPYLVSFFMKEYRTVRHGPGRKGPDAVCEYMLKRFEQYEHVKNKLWTEADQKNKLDELENNLQCTDNIFFICSKHQNCAKDHLPYQGKLYVAEDWMSRTTDVGVARYIKTHTLRTVESVCYSFPFLLTRPNCRHKIVPVRTSTVLSGQWRDEVEYVMDDSKDLRHIKYQQRLTYDIAMKKATGSTGEAVNKRIKRDRRLLRKK